MCPVVTTPGIVVEMFVAVAELANVFVRLTVMLSFPVTVSKFVPVIETGVPAVAIVGAKLVIVGSPFELVTTNDELVVAVPAGEVTEILPLVAPVGTLVTI